MKRLKCGKRPGINGVAPDMIKDGGELVKQSLLWLFNCMLAGHFPECLSVREVTSASLATIFSNYRGITIGSLKANLCNDTRAERCILGMLSKPRGRQASEKNTARVMVGTCVWALQPIVAKGTALLDLQICNSLHDNLCCNCFWSACTSTARSITSFFQGH